MLHIPLLKAEVPPLPAVPSAVLPSVLPDTFPDQSHQCPGWFPLVPFFSVHSYSNQEVSYHRRGRYSRRKKYRIHWWQSSVTHCVCNRPSNKPEGCDHSGHRWLSVLPCNYIQDFYTHLCGNIQNQQIPEP